ncbi:LruC domain-containing protein [Shewanella intestini]|uniref:LruC domain-containing protein n=1 Tax=Shewanella intestini TaxID=2017544 RepID=A0ABS5I0L9_9GAMM|nr:MULTISPECIES: LruC domain-containing protein [Shewanella]MBR9727567.1 LruC domain-containing protein [Shewanella intestini]MRG35283.1 LruC domain-containing protein [Shewanella sp. XMDDZSB0408]
MTSSIYDPTLNALPTPQPQHLFKKRALAIALSATALLFCQTAQAAEPFDACPTEAFIVQTPAGNPIAYGVDLSTGSYVTLSDEMGVNSAINGTGFSYNDNYLYGWDYENKLLSRIDNQYQATPLTMTKHSLVGTTNFYVGDVAIDENVWFGYRKKLGLFRINLDEANPQMELVTNQSNLIDYTITDFAFHPSDGFLYAVTNGTSGKLIKIDPATGEYETIGEVITGTKSFTFGAQFFDPDGNLYLSNNNTGNVYRLNVEDAAPVAELFSYGPSSTSNDGARCALAPVPVGNAVDFADAPDSYGTLIDSNGARHGIVAGLNLGQLVDNESDGYPSPLSDDDSDGNDDDDGISMPTGFEIGESAILLVDTTGSDGYLNAWIDWGQDGQFDEEDRVIQSQKMSDGQTTLSIDVPNWAKAGSTWSRFRLSSTKDILPTGGVSDGEVEDYPLTVTETGVTMTYYPSSSTYTTLAYEDLFPNQGDFDMNDVVMQLRIVQFVKNNLVRRVGFEAQLVAMGAWYHNGFAIQLPAIARSNVQESAIEWSAQGITQSSSPLEAGQTNAVLVFSEDLWGHVTKGNNCEYFRTEDGCGTNYRATWQMTVPFVDAVEVDQMPAFPYDPFIFATPNTDHGLTAKNITDGQNPGRKLEIHLKNKAPTDLFDSRFLGMHDDNSSAQDGQYFQDANGMSWAIEVPDGWQHPVETERLDDAYVEFIDFAADPTGNTSPDWYMTITEELVF